MRTSSIVCRKKNSTASYAPFSPLIFTGRGELDEFVLFHVFFLSCVLKCRRSERHKRTVQGRYFIDVFVWF